MNGMPPRCCSMNRCKTVNIPPIRFRFRSFDRSCCLAQFRERSQKRPDTAASGGTPSKQLLRDSLVSSVRSNFTYSKVRRQVTERDTPVPMSAKHEKVSHDYSLAAEHRTAYPPLGTGRPRSDLKPSRRFLRLRCLGLIFR
jgi:hypothetical protein